MADDLFIGYDHIAYATRETDPTVKVLEELGFVLKIYKQQLNKFDIYITKMVSPRQEVAEIVEPRGPKSVVSELLNDTEATVYHTCFRTNDFHKAQDRMKKAGAITITKPMSIPYPVTQEHKTFLASHMYHPKLGVFEITGPANLR